MVSMRIGAAPRGLWLMCVFLASACTFCAATDNGTASGNGTSTLPPDVSTVTVSTTTPNATTPNATTPANVTSSVPTVNTTTIPINATTLSTVTATTNGTAVVTSQPTTKSQATSISVPTKPGPVTSAASSAAVTDTPSSASQKKTSKFDAGSFVGGIVLTLGVLIVLYLGCKFYASKRGVQYRTIDEHEAII